jgi:hypothetical protein
MARIFIFMFWSYVYGYNGENFHQQPTEKPEQKAHKSKQNGNARVNGASNGDEHNGTVSAPDDDEELMDEDEIFPELAYDSSDPEFEPDAPPRSITRRSQVQRT